MDTPFSTPMMWAFLAVFVGTAIWVIDFAFGSILSKRADEQSRYPHRNSN